jgi:DNA-binding transcriptional MerR regulator
MSTPGTTVAIPNRPIFRTQEVCELADVQAYVLRSWEAEFPDLGVAKTANGPRVYRRADVERVLRIKHLLFVDGLTLAGARRRLSEEGLTPAEEPVRDADLAALIDAETRQELRNLRRGLQWILGVLSGQGVTAEDFVLTAERGPASARGHAARGPAPKHKTVARTARPVRPAKKGRKR